MQPKAVLVLVPVKADRSGSLMFGITLHRECGGECGFASQQNGFYHAITHETVFQKYSHA
jgi:hypothetical protein